MGDIVRNSNNTSILKQNPVLERKHTKIQIEEKKSLINALSLRLSDLTNIEIPKIELQINVLQCEAVELNDKLITIDQ